MSKLFLKIIFVFLLALTIKRVALGAQADEGSVTPTQVKIQTNGPVTSAGYSTRQNDEARYLNMASIQLLSVYAGAAF